MLPSTTQPAESTNLPATQSWGTENTSSVDLAISKVQIAQAVSNVCKEGIRRPGELYLSATKELLAAKGEKVELLPILVVGSWNVYRPVGKELQYLMSEPIAKGNDSDNWKIEDFDRGEPIVKLKQLRFLILLINRVNQFPFYIDFSKSNRNGGKLLSTIMQENKFQGKPAPARVIELSSIIRTYMTNSWFIFGVSPTRPATEVEIEICKKWFDVFSSKASALTEQMMEEDNGIS